jgi:hypothetical protein
MGDRISAWLVFLGGLIAALLVVLIVVVAGDGDDAPATSTLSADSSLTAPGTSAVTTTGAPTTATTAASATTAAAPTTAAPTTAAPPATSAAVCAGIPDSIPPFATDRTSVIGDVDGDGDLDAVTVFQDGGAWFVFVEFGNGYATRAAISPYDPSASPQASSVMNVGVAAEVILVNTGFTLVGPIFGVWHLDVGCNLRQATIDGTAMFEPYGGIGLLHSEGFSCTSDGITLVNATQPGGDEDVWQVEEIALLWVPGLGDFQIMGTTTTVTNRATALAAAASTGC